MMETEKCRGRDMRRTKPTVLARGDGLIECVHKCGEEENAAEREEGKGAAADGPRMHSSTTRASPLSGLSVISA